jgi:WG containing repeat
VGLNLLMISYMRAIPALLCVCLFDSAVSPTQSSTQNHDDKGSQRGESCVFDFEQGEVLDCVYVRPDGARVVASRWLKQLPYGSNGLAGVWIAGGWTYVNRHGEVVITGVPTVDNGPDEFHDGRVRFVKNKKYGFADHNGKAVIPPVYDGALPFHDGRANVCSGCVDKCVDQHCEHHAFSGGHWLRINPDGTILK